jgi:tetratricopeptide (TPR) repeat protein
MDLIRPNKSSNEIGSFSSIDPDENHENITLIWYDTKTIDDESPDVLLTKQSLREINNFVRFFDEQNACLNYIKTILNEKVFLIISGRLCSSGLNLFHSLEQIESIFIFCFHRENYLSLLNQFDKIVGIYTKQDQLTINIKRTIQDCEFNSARFNFSKLGEKYMRNLDREYGSFVFFQLSKEVIHHMPHTNEAKTGMIIRCKKYYHGNDEELKKIEKFEIEYTANDAIKWFTEDSFVYRIINKILRTEDIDAFFAYRFFIHDLSKQISKYHKQFKKIYKSKQLTVYRGMKLSLEEFQIMFNNIGNLFSMNGFMSCSRSCDTALKFATKYTTRHAQYQPVLLEIDVNIIQADKIIFADVSELSKYDEHEILFDIGSAFKLTSCEYDCFKKVYVIRATATNQGADIASDYMEFQKKKVIHSDIDLMIGHLFADMGETHKSRLYFESILKKEPNDEKVACIYYYIARNYRLKNEYDQALIYYNLSYDKHHQAQPPREGSAAKSLNGIGIVYREMKNYSQAAKYLQQALRIYKDYLPSYHADIAAVLNNLGNVYCQMEEFDQAMKYLHQAQSINNKTLPSNHPSNASVLNNIGNVYYKKKEFNQACNVYERVLKIREKALVPEHDDIICSLDNLGLVNCKLNRINKAQEYFQRAQKILQSRRTINNLLEEQIEKHMKSLYEYQRF